ncbi:MAG: helix-turn-helix domain-containing protein [Myxococcota bacterium]
MQATQSERATLTARELAALLRVNRKTVYEAAAQGQIPSIRVGRRVLFPRTAIESWLSASAPASAHATITRPTRVAGKQATR